MLICLLIQVMMIIHGDSNDLKLDSILSLDSRFVQTVNSFTRLNPPAILDPIISTLSCYYQEPQCLEPLDADEGKKGVKSVVSQSIISLPGLNGKWKFGLFPSLAWRRWRTGWLRNSGNRYTPPPAHMIRLRFSRISYWANLRKYFLKKNGFFLAMISHG